MYRIEESREEVSFVHPLLKLGIQRDALERGTVGNQMALNIYVRVTLWTPREDA